MKVLAVVGARVKLPVGDMERVESDPRVEVLILPEVFSNVWEMETGTLIVILPESADIVFVLMVPASNTPEPEALLSPVMSWPLPVICPPNVKSLIVRVPVEFWMVVALRVAVSRVADIE